MIVVQCKESYGEGPGALRSPGFLHLTKTWGGGQALVQLLLL